MEIIHHSFLQARAFVLRIISIDLCRSCLHRNHYIVLHCKTHCSLCIHSRKDRHSCGVAKTAAASQIPPLFLSNCLRGAQLRECSLPPCSQGWPRPYSGVPGWDLSEGSFKDGQTGARPLLSLPFPLLVAQKAGWIAGAPAAAWDHVAVLRMEAAAGSDTAGGQTNEAGSPVTCGAFSPSLDF